MENESEKSQPRASSQPASWSETARAVALASLALTACHLGHLPKSYFAAVLMALAAPTEFAAVSAMVRRLVPRKKGP